MTNGHRSINNTAKGNRLAGWRSFGFAPKKSVFKQASCKSETGRNNFLSFAGEEKKQVLPSESIRHIWTEIFSCSRSLQQKTSLAFLGPAGTFSHFAGLELMGKSLNFVPCHDFNAIFAKVHAGEVRYGLVPLENSLQGTVGQCLDLFEEYPVSIVAEHYSGICQCLLSKQQDMRRKVTSSCGPIAPMRGLWK